jgi:hypothetical protein
MQSIFSNALSEAVAKHIDLSSTRRESTHSGHQPICGDLRELPAFGGLSRDRSQFIRSLPRQCALFGPVSASGNPVPGG